MNIPNFFIFFFLSFFLSVTVSASSHSTSWSSFLNLAGTRRSDTNALLPELKKYLRHFGYLPNYDPSDLTNAASVFDDDLDIAIRTYQQNFNLNVTGVLDMPTIRQLMAPRCGVPDIINGSSSMLSGKNSLMEGDSRWPANKRQLTYALTSTSAVSIDPSILQPIFARAFDLWANVTDFSFSESRSYFLGPDIAIGFYNGDHGDGAPFDGPLKILAHSFLPTDGRTHYDAAEEWVVDGDVTTSPDEGAVDLETVAVHEIGHLLGLGHSSVEESVMFPRIPLKAKKVELSEDDIEEIRDLYNLQQN